MQLPRDDHARPGIRRCVGSNCRATGAPSLFAGLVLLVSMASGCAMCASPYDYCGPTFTGGECDCCLGEHRVASYFSDGGMMYGQSTPITPRTYKSSEDNTQETLPFPDEGPPEGPDSLPTPSLPEPIPADGSARRWQQQHRTYETWQ